MRLLTRLDAPLQLPRPVLTVGTFDGLHLGHRAILETVFREARRLGGSAVVLTFDRHPQAVISGNAPPMLLSREEKRQALEATGLDALVELPFTPELAVTAPEAFVERVIVKGVGAAVVVMGHDHRFGRRRAGDIDAMRALGGRFGFKVVSVGPTLLEGAPVSSTRLRGVIAAGQMAEASRLLGRPYGLRGEVTKGDGRGRQIGFPTANILPDAPEKLLPINGVYVVRVRIGEGWMGGVCNIGTRPTFEGAGRVVEAHLFDFSGDLYGRSLEVAFLSRLRDERKFEDATSLVSQIRADVEAARQRLTERAHPEEAETFVSKIA